MMNPPLNLDIFSILLAHKLRRITGATLMSDSVELFSSMTGVDKLHIESVIKREQHPSQDLLDSIGWRVETVESKYYYPVSSAND